MQFDVSIATIISKVVFKSVLTLNTVTNFKITNENPKPGK